MKAKVVYVFDRSKIFRFLEAVYLQIDPVSGDFMNIPNATEKEPLPDKAGFVQGFVSGGWKYYTASQEYWLPDGSKHKTEDGEELPEGALLEAPLPPEPTFDELMSAALVKRAAAYRAESDPLYIEWQYDKSDEGEAKWREKVQEIKERYPLPTESTE